MSSPSPNRRRWKPRFSLRALAGVTLLVSVCLGWYVSQLRFAMHQQAAVDRISELGGNVTFQYQTDGTAVGRPVPPAFLRAWTGDVILSDAVKASLHAPGAVDADLSVLSRLSKLRDLRLNLRRLTDDGVAPVKRLVHLRRLDLWCPNLTNQSLPLLADLHQLRQLDLYSTQVSDDGLQHLRGLTNLEQLKLRSTNVTSQGAAMLQEALPNCRILGVKGYP